MTFDPRQYREAFVHEVTTSLKIGRTAIAQLGATPPDPSAFSRLARFFHTLAGTAALMGFTEISTRCRLLEGEFRRMGEEGVFPGRADLDTLLQELDGFERSLLGSDTTKAHE